MRRNMLLALFVSLRSLVFHHRELIRQTDRLSTGSIAQSLPKPGASVSRSTATRLCNIRVHTNDSGISAKEFAVDVPE